MVVNNNVSQINNQCMARSAMVHKTRGERVPEGFAGKYFDLHLESYGKKLFIIILCQEMTWSDSHMHSRR